MKRLAVLRHAKSSWDDESLDDFNRPLNERGWEAARRMGREFKRRGMRFDLVIASMAARVRETIDGVQEHYQFGAPVRFDPNLYLAAAGDLLELLRGLPDDVEAPLLVGHNPGLQRLLLELSRDDEKGLCRRIADKFPTGALAVIELPVGHWPNVVPASGTITELISPKELD